jgi:predicted ATP-binding protein involved in virulence
MTTENFHFYIKVRTALSIPARVIHDELNSVYGNEAPGLSTVERWSKLFRDGREEIEDKARPGRPINETTTENIEQVRLLIDDDPYITIEDIQEQTDLSHETVQ